jgi:phosphoribosylformylglycinamidine (FGAM) synthase PurS component
MSSHRFAVNVTPKPGILDEAAARDVVERLASELLANPLIEAYAIEAIGAVA